MNTELARQPNPVEQARNLLLGMLGHDMRSPLNTILTTSSYLAALNAGEQVSVSAARLIRTRHRYVPDLVLQGLAVIASARPMRA